MNCKKSLLWSMINQKFHSSLLEEDRKILTFMPLVSALFPGIDYYSISGFWLVTNTLVVPVLKKRFPELVVIADADLNADETIVIEPFLPSEGYEWQQSIEWNYKFKKLLDA